MANMETTACDLLQDNVAAWDQVADRVESTFPVDALGLERHVRPQDRVLDLGCGNGRVISILYNRGVRRVTGCDPSARMCEFARRRNPHTEILWLANPRGLGMLPGPFDTALLVGVLSSVVPLTERRALVDQIGGLVRQNGVIVVGDFGCSRSRPYADRYRSAVAEPRTFRTAEGVLIHHFTQRELQDLLAPAFNVVESRIVAARTIHGRLLPGHVLVGRRK